MKFKCISKRESNHWEMDKIVTEYTITLQYLPYGDRGIPQDTRHTVSLEEYNYFELGKEYAI